MRKVKSSPRWTRGESYECGDARSSAVTSPSSIMPYNPPEGLAELTRRHKGEGIIASKAYNGSNHTLV